VGGNRLFSCGGKSLTTKKVVGQWIHNVRSDLCSPTFFSVLQFAFFSFLAALLSSIQGGSCGKSCWHRESCAGIRTLFEEEVIDASVKPSRRELLDMCQGEIDDVAPKPSLL
jgi:hypothetical protein